MNINPPRTPAERFASVIDLLYRVLAAQGIKGKLVGALLIAVCSKLRRTAMRFSSLAARAAAGTLPARRAPRPRTPVQPAAPSTPASPPPPAKLRLPTRFGWLRRQIEGEAIHGVAGARSQLAHLLDDPDMVGLITAAPQAGRLIRPICRMLGLRPPPHLALPPRPPRPRRRRRATPVTPNGTPPSRRSPRRRPAAAPPDPGRGTARHRAENLPPERRRLRIAISFLYRNDKDRSGMPLAGCRAGP